MKKIFLSVIFSIACGFSFATKSENESLVSKAMESVNDECEEYSTVLASARWEAIEAKAKANGKRIPEPEVFRRSIRNIEKKQCVLVQNIQILTILKQSVSSAEWRGMSGDKALSRLKSDLVETVNALSM